MKQPKCRCGHKQPTHDKTGCLIPYCRCRSYLPIGMKTHSELMAEIEEEKKIKKAVDAAIAREIAIIKQEIMEQIERELDEAYAKASGF